MHVLVPILGMPLLAVAFSKVDPLSATVLASLVIFIFGGLANAMFTTLSHRLRWVWLSLLTIYVSFTPGEYVFPALAWCPLTFEGLLGAAIQLLKLFAMLAWVSYLLTKYRPMLLVSGMYQGLRLCGLYGAWLEKMVVRLYLILQQPLLSTPVNLSSWFAYVQHPEQLLVTPPEETCTLALSPFTVRDQLVIGLMSVVLVLLMGL